MGISVVRGTDIVISTCPGCGMVSALPTMTVVRLPVGAVGDVGVGACDALGVSDLGTTGAGCEDCSAQNEKTYELHVESPDEIV
jgi:hypothetical protein